VLAAQICIFLPTGDSYLIQRSDNICNAARERIAPNPEAFVSTSKKKKRKKKYRLLLPYVSSIFSRLCISHTHAPSFSLS